MCDLATAPPKTAPPKTAQQLQIADIFRDHAKNYRENHQLSGQQDKVMRAILQCRTAILGGYKEQCDVCGDITYRYHSCRNRHCSQCQAVDSVRWVESRMSDLLSDTQYFHLVFTLPHDLNSLAQGNPRVIYNILFKSASETLQTFGRDPKWLGGEIGASMVLHTWSQNLGLHIHVHCIIPGGALSKDGKSWIPAKKGFLFRVEPLSMVFKSKFLNYLKIAQDNGELKFGGSVTEDAFRFMVAKLYAYNWVVYAKKPFADAEKVVRYLGRYTHRVAIANKRLISLDSESSTVQFYWKDYAHADKIKKMTLPIDEFIRRFLLHVLPSGFMRIRHYGILANRSREEKLNLCRILLGQSKPETKKSETFEAIMLRLTGVDVHLCQVCKKKRAFADR